MNTEILKNKYVKITLIVIGFLLFSNILGYLLTGIAIVGSIFYFLKKSKGGELAIYEENEKTSKTEIDKSFDKMFDDIKKNRGV